MSPRESAAPALPANFPKANQTLESFVNYPLWHVIGATDRWVAHHEALGPRVVVLLAIPGLALSLIANVLLFVRRPPAVPAWTVAATLSLLLVSTASTFAIQIPIQMALDVAYDRAALDDLIWSSLWLRDIPGGIRAAVAAYMLRLVVSGSPASSPGDSAQPFVDGLRT